MPKISHIEYSAIGMPKNMSANMNDARANAIYKALLDIVVKSLGNQTTWSETLNQYGRKYISGFDGVYAADQIPKKYRNIIVNLDKSDEPGSHWIAVRDSKTPIIYDSFGRKSSKIIPTIGKGIDTDYDAEQTKSETNCGQRSLAWLLLAEEWGTDLALLI